MTDGSTTVALAKRFALAVAARDHDRAEDWAEAAFRHEGFPPREVHVHGDGDETEDA